MSYRRKQSHGERDRAIGDRLRLARNMAGLTQSELGETLGVTFQQVQKYERGSNAIAAAKLELAAKRLGHPIAWFFDAPSEAPPDDREALRLGTMIARLAEPGRSDAIRVLQIIVSSYAAAPLACVGD